MYSINLTDQAELDLNTTVDYYVSVLKANKAAVTFLDEIEAKFTFLSTDPLVYEIETDEYLKERKIRSVLVKNHMIFYVVDQNNQEVIVLRILYARRNWLWLLRSSK